jgi:hypothetical protein
VSKTTTGARRRMHGPRESRIRPVGRLELQTRQDSHVLWKHSRCRFTCNESIIDEERQSCIYRVRASVAGARSHRHKQRGPQRRHAREHDALPRRHLQIQEALHDELTGVRAAHGGRLPRRQQPHRPDVPDVPGMASHNP